MFAAGVGANAGVLGVMDRVFLRQPARVNEPTSLRRVFVLPQSATSSRDVRDRFSWPEARAIDSATRGRFPTAFYVTKAATQLEWSGVRSAVVTSAWVTPAYFRVLGVPVSGLAFRDDDLAFGEPATRAIVSWQFWSTALDRDPATLGSVIRVAGRPVSIVGVAAAGFTGTDLVDVSIWLPLSGASIDGDDGWYESRGNQVLSVLARAPSGTDAGLGPLIERTLRREAHIERQASREAFGDTAARAVLGPLVVARGPHLESREQSVVLLLAGTAALLLLLAVANVTGLMVARAIERREEFATQMALGMDRVRLFVSVAAEAIMLASIAAVLAVLLGGWLSQGLRMLILPTLTWSSHVFDLRTGLVSFALAMVGALTSGAACARMVTSGWNTSAKRHGDDLLHSRWRSLILGTQFAMAMTLLVGAGLLGRSVANILRINVGYDAERVVTVYTGAAGTGAAQRIADYARGLPGVDAVVLTALPPMDGLIGARLIRAAGDTVRLSQGRPGYVAAEPAYLPTVGTRIVEGRGLTPSDGVGAPRVMVVGVEMARRLWPGGSPLGDCIHVQRMDDPCYRVVGIAEDVVVRSLFEAPPVMFYLTLDQTPGQAKGVSGVVIRTRGEARSIAAQVRRELGRLIPLEQAASVWQIEERLATERRPWTAAWSIMMGFAGLGLAIAAIGAYCVVASTVRRRTRELGIRVALGASPTAVLRLVVGETVRAATIGIVVGAGASVLAAKAALPLLYGIPPHDAVSLGATALALFACAVVAAGIPAWNAIRQGPVRAISRL